MSQSPPMQEASFRSPSEEALGSLSKSGLRLHRWLQRRVPRIFRAVSSVYFFPDGALIVTPSWPVLRVIEGDQYIDIEFTLGSAEVGPGSIFLSAVSEWKGSPKPISLSPADYVRIRSRLEEYAYAKKAQLAVR